MLLDARRVYTFSLKLGRRLQLELHLSNALNTAEIFETGAIFRAWTDEVDSRNGKREQISLGSESEAILRHGVAVTRKRSRALSLRFVSYSCGRLDVGSCYYTEPAQACDIDILLYNYVCR